MGGILTLLFSQETDPVNLGNPVEHSILDLAELTIRLTGSRSKLQFLPSVMDDPRRRKPDIGLAKEKLAWGPTIGLEEGLKRTIEYFKENLV